MKSLFVYLTIISFASAHSQTFLKASYSYKYEKVGFEAHYTLYYSNGISHYKHHHYHQKIVNEKGWEFYFPHEFHDWYYDQVPGKITEYAELEDGTKLKATWPADFKWKLTDEWKKLNGYDVQKAIGLSHNTGGRGEWDTGDVIAWFSTEIPGCDQNTIKISKDEIFMPSTINKKWLKNQKKLLGSNE